MHHLQYFRAPATAVALVASMLASAVGVVLPVAADPPGVHLVDPAKIKIDGNSSDWDTPGSDEFAALPKVGGENTKPLAQLFARYECSTKRMFVLVKAANGWLVVPSDSDNYVK